MHWVHHLPWSVEAFISSRSGASTAAHKRFLAAFPAISDKDVPLLTITPRVDEPFAEGVAYGELGDPTRLKRFG